MMVKFWCEKSGKHKYRCTKTGVVEDMVLAIDTYSEADFKRMTTVMQRDKRKRERIKQEARRARNAKNYRHANAGFIFSIIG